MCGVMMFPPPPHSSGQSFRLPERERMAREGIWEAVRRESVWLALELGGQMILVLTGGYIVLMSKLLCVCFSAIRWRTRCFGRGCPGLNL
jgi:hypothetical protein